MTLQNWTFLIIRFGGHILWNIIEWDNAYSNEGSDIYNKVISFLGLKMLFKVQTNRNLLNTSSQLHSGGFWFNFYEVMIRPWHRTTKQDESMSMASLFITWININIKKYCGSDIMQYC